MRTKNSPVHKMILSLFAALLFLICNMEEVQAQQGFSEELNLSRNLFIRDRRGQLDATANPIKGKLAPDDHKSTDGTAFDLYFFKGVKFEKIDIEMRGETMDYSAIIIFDSNNKQVRYSNLNRNHKLTLYLPQSGTYRILVTTQQPIPMFGMPGLSPSDDQKYGNYELSVKTNYIKHWQDSADSPSVVDQSSGQTPPNQAEPGDLVLRRIVINPGMLRMNPPPSHFAEGYINNGLKVNLEISIEEGAIEIYERLALKDGKVDIDQRGSFKLKGTPPLVIRMGDEMEFTISGWVKGEAPYSFESNFSFSDITSLNRIEGPGPLKFWKGNLKFWKKEREGWSASRRKRWVCMHTERPLTIYWGIQGYIIKSPGVKAMAFEYKRAGKREIVKMPTPIDLTPKD